MTEEEKFVQFFAGKFSDAEILQAHEEDWMMLDAKLRKKKFTSFGWSYFNIYYAIAILASFFFTILMGGHYLFFLNAQQTFESQKLTLPDVTTKLPEDSGESAAYENVQIPEPATGRSSSPVAETSSQTKKPSRENFKAVAEPADTVFPDVMSIISDAPDSSITLTVTDSFPPEKAEPVIKKVILYTQDTIIRYDSIKIKPKFPFGKKNK